MFAVGLAVYVAAHGGLSGLLDSAPGSRVPVTLVPEVRGEDQLVIKVTNRGPRRRFYVEGGFDVPAHEAQGGVGFFKGWRVPWPDDPSGQPRLMKRRDTVSLSFGELEGVRYEDGSARYEWWFFATDGRVGDGGGPSTQVKVRVYRADSGAYLERTFEVSGVVDADGNSKASFRSLRVRRRRAGLSGRARSSLPIATAWTPPPSCRRTVAWPRLRLSR